MRFLKTNTAVIVTVGPFYDKTDGVTIENALTATNERITLTVDLDDGNAPTLVLDNITGAASATSNDIVVITNCDAGLYQIELAAANVNYLGRAMLTITDAANHVPVFHEFMIVSAQFYNFMCGATIPDVNVTKVGGTSQTAGDVCALVVTADAAVDVAVADIAAVHTLCDTIEADTNELQVDWVNGGRLDLLLDAAALPTAATIADAVWDEVLSGHVGATTVGKAVTDILADTDELQVDWVNGGRLDLLLDGASAPTAAAVADAVWDEALSGHAGGGSAGAALTAAGSSGDPWSTELPGAYGAGTAGKKLADACTEVSAVLVDTGTTLDAKIDGILTDTGTTLDAAIAAIKAETALIVEDTAVIGALGAGLTALATQASVDAVKAETALIVADTNELQTDWVNGGRLDLLLDGASAPTAAAVADAVWDEAAAGHVAAGSLGKAVADAASAGDPWSTAIPGAYGAGTAGKKVSDMVAEVTAILVDTGTTLDAKIDAIDTVVDAILVDTGTTLDAALAVVDANVDAILVDTGTTLDTKINTIDTVVDAISVPSAAAVADAVWDESLAAHAISGSTGSKLAAVFAGVTSSIAGLGAITNVITVTVSGSAKSGVDVWVTSDEVGATVVAGTLVTNASGQVTFYLDPGTYYVWQQLTGYNFTNPDTLTVT